MQNEIHALSQNLQILLYFDEDCTKHAECHNNTSKQKL